MDIVDRLRKKYYTVLDAYDIMDEAAEEIERLRAELSKCQASDEMLNECCSDLDRVKAEKEHYIKVWSDVCDENQGLLNEIERLKAELEAETQRRWDGNRIASAEATADFNEMRDMAVKEMARWAREAGASQAGEAKLREALEALAKLGNGDVFGSSLGNQMAFNAFCLPYDDTALKEAIKQGQRETLLEAAAEFDSRGEFQGHGESLRRMAGGIK
jgi:uncharacterized small protein (DUF1192 family)